MVSGISEPLQPLKKNTGGVPYHRKFTWLELDTEYAHKVSFIELIPVPTTGQKSEDIFWVLFDLIHASRVDELAHSQSKKMIVISSTVMNKYMQSAKLNHGVFDCLPEKFKLGRIKILDRSIIYGAPHFSSTTFKREVFKGVGLDIQDFCKS